MSSLAIADSAKNIDPTGLRNQHAIEDQTIGLLEPQCRRRHIEEIHEQGRRLE